MNEGLLEVTVYLFHKDGQQVEGLATFDPEHARTLGAQEGYKVSAVKFAATHVETAWDFETRDVLHAGDEVKLRDEYMDRALLVKALGPFGASHVGTRGIITDFDLKNEGHVVVTWTDDDPEVGGWSTSLPVRVLERVR